MKVYFGSGNARWWVDVTGDLPVAAATQANHADDRCPLCLSDKMHGPVTLGPALRVFVRLHYHECPIVTDSLKRGCNTSASKGARFQKRFAGTGGTTEVTVPAHLDLGGGI